MTSRYFALAAAALTASLALAPLADAREGRVRARGQNGVAAAGAGPEGGAYARGRGAVKNEDGSITSGSGAAIRGPNGARGARASTTTVNPDGSATHNGGFAAEGAQGEISSQGSLNRAADGTLSGSRTTTATSATTGTTYNGATTIDPTTGKPVRSGSCTNASGEVIACPTR